MSTINGVNYNGTAAVPQPGSAFANSLGQQDFMRLMVAQVRNQDPMQPQTNGDFLAQLAQFSTNDGIGRMQKSMDELSASFQSNQALQASTLVGRKVMVASNALNLAAEGDCKIMVDVPAPVSNLKACVYSENGELISTVPLGEHTTGSFDFTWNGLNDKGQRMPAGKYVVKVNGIYKGSEVGLRTMTTANVDSVSLSQNGEAVKLNVAGIGQVSLNDVRKITI